MDRIFQQPDMRQNQARGGDRNPRQDRVFDQQDWRGNRGGGNDRKMQQAMRQPNNFGGDWKQFRQQQKLERRNEQQAGRNYWDQMTTLARDQQSRAFNRSEDWQGNWDGGNDRHNRRGRDRDYSYVPYNGFRSFYTSYVPYAGDTYNYYNSYTTYNNYDPYGYSSYVPYYGYTSYVPYSYTTYNYYGYDPYSYYAYDPYGYNTYYVPYTDYVTYNGYDPYYGYDPYGSYYSSYDPYAYNGYNSGFSWKQLLLNVVLQNVLGNVLGGGGNGYYDNYNYAGYDPYNYNQSPDYGYNSGYYSQPYYRSSSGYYDTPYYNEENYDGDYDNSYYDQYGYDNTGYNDSIVPGYVYGDSYDQLPIGSLLGRYNGGSLTDLLRQALSIGYDRGYVDGQNARYYNAADEYYYDPYAYPDRQFSLESVNYDPYNSYLSQGYNLGYQDAMYGENQYDPYNGGSADLVSLVLNSVLN